MIKVTIRIGIIGHLPFVFNRKKIENWRSEIFEVTGVSDYTINTPRADTIDWEYSDHVLNSELPQRDGEDIFIGITYVPIENNYYMRRLENNRLIVSFCGIYEDIVGNNIPIENLLLKIMYEASMIFITEKAVPSTNNYQRPDFLHDDTRGCIFDMTGNDKRDVIYSLDRPQLCEACKAKLREKKIPNNKIDKINAELKRIKKDLLYQIYQWVKRKPLLSILITFVVGVVMSLVANFIYDLVKCL